MRVDENSWLKRWCFSLRNLLPLLKKSIFPKRLSISRVDARMKSIRVHHQGVSAKSFNLWKAVLFRQLETLVRLRKLKFAANFLENIKPMLGSTLTKSLTKKIRLAKLISKWVDHLHIETTRVWQVLTDFQQARMIWMDQVALKRCNLSWTRNTSKLRKLLKILAPTMANCWWVTPQSLIRLTRELRAKKWG